MKIGIIIPSSSLFPAAALQFTDGIALAAKLYSQGEEIDLVIENVGIGCNRDKIKNAADKLLIQDRVDIIIAWVGPSTYSMLEEISAAHKKIILLADMGGFINYKTPASKYVFIHSLQEWSTAYRLGESIAQEGATMIPAISMMDAGYHVNYPLLNQFEKNGGTLLGYYTMPIQAEPSSYENLKQAINEHGPKWIYMGFTGKDADMFIDNMSDALSTKEMHLVGMGWLTTADKLEKYGKYLNGTLTASPYYSEIENEENEKFKTEFNVLTGNHADSFSVLGYECCMALLKAAQYTDSGKLLADNTIKTLESLSFESPRGNVSYNATGHYTVADAWMAEVVENDGKFINKIKHCHKANDLEVWRSDEQNQPNGGWLNPYPCT